MKFQPNLIPRFNLDYTFSDLIHGLKSIFINSDTELTTLIGLFENKRIFFTNNGRSSLYVILKSLNLPKGSKIGVPLYSCTVVFDAILKARYVPHFIDIDMDNYTLDPNDLEKKIDDISAVVVIHTFGRPAEMDKIRNISKNLPIIEDCSHSLLSKYKGKLTGTMGDASFFSLTKYISAGGGGMIVLNDDGLINNLEHNIDVLISPSILTEFLHILYIYTYSFLYHKPWYGGFAFQIGSYIKHDISVTCKKTFESTKIKKTDFTVFLKKLGNFKEHIELQRTKAQILINGLHNADLTLPYENKVTWCNYYLFPILFNHKRRRDAACDLLKKMGIDSAKLYSETPALSKKFYNYVGDCPNTENLAERILVIPNYYTISDNELLKIVNVITKMENDYENNVWS